MQKVVFDLVYNRKKVLNNQEKALLQVRIYHNRSYKFNSTNIYLKPKEWDTKSQRIKSTHPNYILLNKDLGEILSRLEDQQSRINRILSSKEIEDLIFGKLEGTNSFIEYIEKKLSKDKRIAYNTYRAKTAKLNIIYRYGKINSFADLTYQNIVDFDNYLVSEKKAESTIRKYHQLVSEYITKAILEKLFLRDDNPYERFKPRNPKGTKIKYLTAEELTRIEEKEFTTDRLKVIKDLFLFSCYTGLSYGDISELKETHYSVDYDGIEWIVKNRSKTDNEFKVPLIPRARIIFHKYIELKGKTIFPVKSNQKMNEYLKEIKDLCDINKDITFHMARHTFATTVTMMHGVSVESVSKMLGHTNIKTTQIYAKIVDERIKNDMKGLL